MDRAFLHVEVCFSGALMKDTRNLFLSKGFNDDYSKRAAVWGTRKTFSVTLPELTVSVTAPPLCSLPCVVRLQVKLWQHHHDHCC